MTPVTSTTPNRHESVAIVYLPNGAAEPAHVQLLAGRPGADDRQGPSAGWYGRLQWLHPGVRIRPCTELRVELDNGRTAIALAVPVHAVADVVELRGLGSPPFDVL